MASTNLRALQAERDACAVPLIDALQIRYTAAGAALWVRQVALAFRRPMLAQRFLPLALIAAITRFARPPAPDDASPQRWPRHWQASTKGLAPEPARPLLSTLGRASWLAEQTLRFRLVVTTNGAFE